MTPRTIIPIRDLDAAAEASGDPDAWAEARILRYWIQRRVDDLAPVLAEIDTCPDTAAGRALARWMRYDCDRREREIAELTMRLERLRRDAPGTVRLAEEHAKGQRIWIRLPNGRSEDQS